MHQITENGNTKKIKKRLLCLEDYCVELNRTELIFL